jgi:hypothetical protein
LNVSRNWTLSKGVNVVHGDPNSTHPSDGLTPRMRTYSTPHENLAQAVQGKLLIQISLIENSATTTGVLRGERYWRRRIR